MNKKERIKKLRAKIKKVQNHQPGKLEQKVEKFTSANKARVSKFSKNVKLKAQITGKKIRNKAYTAHLKASIASLQRKYGKKFVFIKDGLLYIDVKIIGPIAKEENLNKWMKQDIENENYVIFKKKPPVSLKQKMTNSFGNAIKKKLEKKISKIIKHKIILPDLPSTEK